MAVTFTLDKSQISNMKVRNIHITLIFTLHLFNYFVSTTDKN